MKNYFLFFLKCILLVALILGCSTLQVKREVHENTFISSNPNLAVQVNPEFKYVGNPRDRGSGTSISGRDLKRRWESYCFIEPNEDQVEKLVAIQIDITETYFVSDFFRKVKNTLGKGTTDFGGKKFQYYTQPVHPKMTSHMTRQITEQGYKLPFGLVKVFGRIYGAKGNTLVKIYYYEALENSEFDNSSWENTDNITQKQKDYLRDFNEKANLAFELMP